MTIKTGVPHTKLLVCAGMCFVPLPHLWACAAISFVIDWLIYIATHAWNRIYTSLSALKIHGLAECTGCTLLLGVCLCETLTARVRVHWLRFLLSFSFSLPLLSVPYPISSKTTPILPTPPPPTSHPPPTRSPIPHPFRGAWEHAVEITEPIKTLPGSIHSVRLT